MILNKSLKGSVKILRIEILDVENVNPLDVNKKEDYGLPPTPEGVGIRPTIL
mgnify:CR=1 FL=1